MKLLKILFIIVALFFFALICGGYFVAVAQAGGIGFLLALVGTAVVTTLCAVISRPIASARSKQPRYSAGQKEALAQAASDRARQRDMMYVHYLNVETELGSIASNSGKIADAAELYSAKYY